MQAGIGEIGILEREDRALPDVGIDDLVAGRQRRWERQVGLLRQYGKRSVQRRAVGRRELAAHAVRINDTRPERDRPVGRDRNGPALSRDTVVHGVVAEIVGPHAVDL
ncbi:hypothetical protein LGR54_05530 [Ancylobacter sp. Lp-2]|uniref:hypothetical protein n=1 Tax=Ancylobacter sp. Lp-2 TaxID=2881339 RepID=UPI001E57BA1D|nr:hypothetical protein [Ancylobacter sp. Lp-2]MCB4768057.1 hypothetical protein [Ancylobacter sp. Lp-2]